MPGAVAFSADRSKALEVAKIVIQKPNQTINIVEIRKELRISCFLCLELYTKLTARRTDVRLRARQNVDIAAFCFVSCILHLNSSNPKRGHCLTQHPYFCASNCELKIIFMLQNIIFI